MIRLSLGARLTTMVVVSLIAAWLAALMLAYRTRLDAGPSPLPSAQQVAAIVELVEAAPAAMRPRILAAVDGPTLDVEIGAPRSADDVSLPLAALPALDGLDGLLGDRPFSLSATSGQRALLWVLSGGSRPGIRIEVALRTGETLDLVSRNPPGITRLGLPVGLGAGLFGTLIALVALLLMNRETRPIARLAAAVDRLTLAGEPLSLPDSRWSAPEIRALVAAFGRLQQRLAELLRARMAMLGGISHDVRTFATRLRLRVEGIADESERERAIADISDMIRLLDDALLASRSGAGELAEELIDFDEIVSGDVDDRRAAGAAVTLSVAREARAAAVIGDRLALRRVVGNLIDNALKYGHVADLRLESDGEHLRLVVDDRGPGIRPELRAQLLEPFVRLETSRNRATGGAGLGLAVVRNLVESHGGTLTIDDAPGGGARFVVELPVFAAE